MIPATVALLVLAACAPQTGRPDSSDVGTSPDAVADGELWRVAALNVGGGLEMATWGTREIDSPDLAVYADGRAIVSANLVLTLPRQEVDDLVAALRRDLAGQPGQVPRPQDVAGIADAATTKLAVATTDGRMQSVSAYALGETRDYPKQLRTARDRLARVADRVKRDGTSYTADHVRLVTAHQRYDNRGSVRPWPETVAVPAGAGRESLMTTTTTLSGQAATAVVQAMPPRRPSGPGYGLWRLPNGKIVAVYWRYVLPDE
jgi:hypothetical protein